MGEIAEMMLDGTLCESCGVYLQGHARGFPRRCFDCKRDAQQLREHPPVMPGSNKTACKTCGRHVKLAGIADHMRDAHGAKATGSAS
jgi:hypothetical protein